MLYFTPGPSQLYPTVSAHTMRALEQNVGAISHRSAAYKEIHRRADLGLRALAQIPDSHSILFFASATEIWERLIQNLTISEEETLHFVNGAFSQRFAQIAGELQRKPRIIKAEYGEGFEFDAHLAPAKLINFTHNESATGVMQALTEVYAYADAHPESLITLDVVSSFPFPVLDFSKLDAVYFSVQKGMGLPAGLGVLIASPRLIETATQLQSQGQSIGSYHGFPSMAEKAAKYQTSETPNVWAINLLAGVVEDMLAYGIENIRKDTWEKYALLENAISQHSELSPFVKKQDFRSKTVITLSCEGDSKNYIDRLKSKGFVIGDGYDLFKGKQIRIANFPAHSAADMADLCKAL